MMPPENKTDLIRESFPRLRDKKKPGWRGAGASWVGRAAGNPAGQPTARAPCRQRQAPARGSAPRPLRPNHRTEPSQSPPPEHGWPMGERRTSPPAPAGCAALREKTKPRPRRWWSAAGRPLPGFTQTSCHPPDPGAQRDRAGPRAKLNLRPLSHRSPGGVGTWPPAEIGWKMAIALLSGASVADLRRSPAGLGYVLTYFAARKNHSTPLPRPQFPFCVAKGYTVRENKKRGWGAGRGDSA